MMSTTADDATPVDVSSTSSETETQTTDDGKDTPPSTDVTEEIDPWDLVDDDGNVTKWSDLTTAWKIWRVVWIILRLCIVVGLLYIFVCSLDVLQYSFQLLSGRTAGNLFTSPVINNPVCGLMIGVLVTVLVQSSSTSTSIIVSLVGAGVLGVRQSIPIIMGANIGTTVTNTIVALTQSADRDIFRRAFGGATVHDMFNWLTVILLLPIEAATGYLYYMTSAMVSGMTPPENPENPEFLKVITKPLTKLIVEVDKKVIMAIAEQKDRQKFPLVKYYCKEVKAEYSIEFPDGQVNETAESLVHDQMFSYDVHVANDSGFPTLSWTHVLDVNSTKCKHLFVGSGMPGAALTEAGVGAILLVVSLIVLTVCLIILVKTLSSMLRGPLRRVVRRAVNSDFPGRAAFLTGYMAMLVGAGCTVLVQSSSVFTSAMTPLVGIGVITVERVYPLTLGSNIGTTVTGLLAALTADADMVHDTIQIALCHLFFNVTGIIIWYPIPLLRRIPISLAKKLGNTTAVYRWFAVIYLILLYLLLPAVVFALSLAGWYVLLAVGGPVVILAVTVVVINVLQSKRPHWLHPKVLRTWHWLPRPLRSLAPYDRIITACCRCKHCCRCCRDDAPGSSKDELPEPEVIVDYTLETSMNGGAKVNLAYSADFPVAQSTENTAL